MNVVRPSTVVPPPSARTRSLWIIGSVLVTVVASGAAVGLLEGTRPAVRVTLDECTITAGFPSPILAAKGAITNLTSRDHGYQVTVTAYEGAHLVGVSSGDAGRVSSVYGGDTAEWSASGLADGSHPLPPAPTCKVSVAELY